MTERMGNHKLCAPFTGVKNVDLFATLDNEDLGGDGRCRDGLIFGSTVIPQEDY